MTNFKRVYPEREFFIQIRQLRKRGWDYFCDMDVDMLIIGQGICGTLVSWFLEKAGISFLVIDESRPSSASKAAAGIINPVTGRRLVKTWMIDELIPSALEIYRSIELELDLELISPKKIIEFFPTPQMLDAFIKRYEADQQYLHKPVDDKKWSPYFAYEFQWGEIQPCYLVDLQTLLAAYRKRLAGFNRLIDEYFTIRDLTVTPDKITYKDIHANSIVFCDGIESFENPYFRYLPFAPSKGEALIIEVMDLPPDHIYKKKINMVPWEKNLFWVGSSYEWEFPHDRPTAIFRERTEMILMQWLKMPFRTIDHFAAVRPATLERRPFVGFHPIHKNLGLFNGMGTKGCSLAPFFAKQLVQYYQGIAPIKPEADLQRFSGILSRNQE